MADDKDWHASETYRSLITPGANAIKVAFVLNGGALVALVAFLGDRGPEIKDKDGLRCAVLSFIAGVAASAFATVDAYLTQLRLYNETLGRARSGPHGIILWLTILAVGLSILLFCYGAHRATSALVAL